MNDERIEDLTPGYDAVRRGAGIVDRPDRTPLVVAGTDRVGWLQGLLSNDIAGLAEWQGCYATYLTPQGRMLADVHVANLGPVLLVDIPAIVRPQVVARLEQFIITEEVELADVAERIGMIALHGPGAARLLGATLAPAGGAADAHELAAALTALRENDATSVATLARAHAAAAFALDDPDAIVVGNRDCGVLGFNVFVAASREPAIRAALQRHGAVPVSAVAWNTLRIEAGRPLFGIDMDQETIPLEAGIEDRAISFTKGCFVGQEVIVRVRDRGHGRIARKLVGLLGASNGDGACQGVSPGDVVRVDAREVGRVTSTEFSPALGRAIALAYIHRDFLEEGTRVSVLHQDHEFPMSVAILPFVAEGGEEQPE